MPLQLIARLKALMLSALFNPFVWVFALCMVYIYYVLFLYGNFNNITLRLMMNAKQAGDVTIHMIDARKNSKIYYSRKISFPAGKKEHQIQMPKGHGKISLKFSFDEKPNQVLINHGTLVKNGNARALNVKKTFENHLVKPNVDWWPQDKGVVLLLDNGKSSFELHHIPVPLTWPMLVPLLIILIPFIKFAQSKLVHNTRYIYWSTRLLVICGIILSWFALTADDVAAWQICSTTTLFALAVTFWIMTIGTKRNDKITIETIITIATVAIFIQLLFIPMTKMVSANFITRTFAAVVESKAKSQPTGTDAQIKAFRESVENQTKRLFFNRKNLIHYYAWVKLNLFGDSPKKKVLYGKNRMFFEGYGDRRVEGDITSVFDNVTDYVGLAPFTNEQLSRWKKVIEERYCWLKERGIGYVFALAPTKAQIYGENLPDQILNIKNRLNRQTRYDQLIVYLKENCAVPIVDLRAALRTAKNEPPDLPLYYRTDFHWNFYGAFIAYQAIIESMINAYPEFNLVSAKMNEFDIKRRDDWVHARFIGWIGLIPAKQRDETYLTFYPKEGSRYHDVASFIKPGISDYTLPRLKPMQIGNKKKNLREYRYDQGKLSSLLIIGDSFIEKVGGYFSIHSKQTINYRAVNQFPTSLIEELKPDIVVQEILNMYILQNPPGNPPAIRGKDNETCFTALKSPA